MSSRLRVATIVTRLEAGAGEVALRGALALDPARYAVSIVAGSGSRLLGEAASAGLEVLLEPALRSPISPADDVAALRNLTRLLRARRDDVVHTHSAKAGALGRIAAHRSGVGRIVHTFHGLPYHEFQSAARRRTYIAIERRLGRITDVALCVGTGVAVEVVRRGLAAPERVRTIGVASGGLPTPCVPRTRARARGLLGLPADVAVVGAVGRLAYQKAPEDFVAAMVALRRPEVVGVWVGGGPLAERMRTLAGRALPQARVVLAGERADVREVLPAFDVFALPSRYEGLPVAIVEAMTCGIPVVATAVNAVSDVVVPGRTGLLVPPHRPRLLAAAVAHLLDHPDEAARMAESAKASLGDRFADRTLGDALTAAYVGTTARIDGRAAPDGPARAAERRTRPPVAVGETDARPLPFPELEP
ncbi:glycosyltransferase [Pseudonocardia hispaniensis]|uniref:Glycosyltransferase n=1 Tax=Pseudonocardia hispaniensis TaxID=904933 RepID=A0ABW1J7Y4_9PSEU